MAKKARSILIVVMIIALVALVGVLELQRQAISAQLQDVTKQIQDGQLADEQEQNQRLAEQIIEEVRKLIAIPDDVEPTVATIVDVEQLRARNPFYNKAENGDHLVVTRERAILYSSKEKKIIDVVPVEIEPTKARSSEQ